MLDSSADPLTDYCPACNEAFPGALRNQFCPRCGMPADSSVRLAIPTVLWHTSNPALGPPMVHIEDDRESLEQLIGTTFDRYLIESMLGRGGMGWVFLARHQSLNRACALKILSPALVRDDPDYLERFRSEGEAAATRRAVPLGPEMNPPVQLLGRRD